MAENREKLPEADRAEIEREIESAKKSPEQNKDAKDTAGVAALKDGEEKLKKALYKIGEMMYRNAQGALQARRVQIRPHKRPIVGWSLRW